MPPHDLHGRDHRPGRSRDPRREGHHPSGEAGRYRAVHEHDRPARRAALFGTTGTKRGGDARRAGQRGHSRRGGRYHVGDLGHGLAMKLINNMLGQIATVAIAEALVFGKKAGLDPSKIFEVVSVSTGNSVQFQNRVPRMLARNFAPGGTIDISYKDQELETGYAKALGVPLLMANLSQQVYQMGRAAGLNKEDGSAIIKVFERMVGVTSGGDD